MFTAQEYTERRAELRKRMQSGIILFLGNTYSSINYPANAYRFRQDSNFLYYFGLKNPNFAGIIDIEGGQDYIFGDDFDTDDIIWMGPQPSVQSLAASVGVGSTRQMADLAVFVERAIRDNRRVHFLPPYRGEQVLTLSELLGIAPAALSAYISPALVHAVIEQRAVKRFCEILELEHAAEIGYRMHTTAMRMATPGAHEQEIAGVLEGIAHSYGAGTSFSTILSQHGETLHNEVHDGCLELGKLLLVDCGAETNMHYASDNTRTIPVGGEYTDVQKHVYNTVLRGTNQGMALARPGVKYVDVHNAVCRTLTEGLIELGVMKGNPDEAVASGAHALFMPHGLGHMMGLDTHDMEGLGETNVGYDHETKRSEQFGTASLRCGRRLKPGFVVTVEPGIYFIPALIQKWKDLNINHNFINFTELENFLTFGGIRLEEDILITEDGARLIGKERIPIELDEVCSIVKNAK